MVAPAVRAARLATLGANVKLGTNAGPGSPWVLNVRRDLQAVVDGLASPPPGPVVDASANRILRSLVRVLGIEARSLFTAAGEPAVGVNGVPETGSSFDGLTIVTPTAGPQPPGPVPIVAVIPPGGTFSAWFVGTKNNGLTAPLIDGFGAVANLVAVGAPGFMIRWSVFDTSLPIGPAAMLTNSGPGPFTQVVMALAVAANGDFLGGLSPDFDALY